jgi:hypothetical protein
MQMLPAQPLFLPALARSQHAPRTAELHIKQTPAAQHSKLSQQPTLAAHQTMTFSHRSSTTIIKKHTRNLMT